MITDASMPYSSPILDPGSDDDQLLKVSLGPQHPSTHGVFRMNVVLDGETVVSLKPVFGYLHRNHEKIAEGVTYLSSMPYTDRLDYICPLSNNWAYAHAVEKLAGIEVPERAQYMRVILAELTRLINHTAFMGFILGDMGAWGSALMYAFREREKILDLFEDLTGARMMANFMRFGGCRNDLPVGWIEKVRVLVDDYSPFLDEMDRLLTGNEILLARTQDVGALPASTLINGGITGPMLRAAGVNYDIRKVEPYGIYDRLDFRIPLGDKGDCYDRIRIRFLEMHESLKILRQALNQIPDGDFIHPKAKIRNFKPPVGEAYGRIEGPKGELGFYLISDGTTTPYRYRVRPPSFINLTLLEDMCKGLDLADVVIILGSVDIVLGEVDR
jgi:NADH-quinone oxidoreductase subunit D